MDFDLQQAYVSSSNNGDNRAAVLSVPTALSVRRVYSILGATTINENAYATGKIVFKLANNPVAILPLAFGLNENTSGNTFISLCNGGDDYTNSLAITLPNQSSLIVQPYELPNVTADSVVLQVDQTASLGITSWYAFLAVISLRPNG